MEEGEQCTALVAGLPVDYISDTLSLNTSDGMVYSYIIRRDGSFVIRSGVAAQDNYFEQMYVTFNELGGTDADMYVTALKNAIERGEEIGRAHV